MTNNLINLFRQSENYFFRNISKKCLDINSGTTAYMTGVPTQDLNITYVRENTNSIDEIPHQCRQFYNAANLPFVVIIPEEFCPSEMKNKLEHMGYTQTGRSLAMSLDLKTQHTKESNPEIIIRLNNNNLTDWMMPLVEAFESTFKLTKHYAHMHETALQNGAKLYHFSLYKDSKPISSITLSIYNTAARIDDVGTLPTFRNKGYATRLVEYVLLEAQKLGATQCFLESSDLSISIYHKLGFIPLFRNNIYSYVRSE